MFDSTVSPQNSRPKAAGFKPTVIKEETEKPESPIEDFKPIVVKHKEKPQEEKKEESSDAYSEYSAFDEDQGSDAGPLFVQDDDAKGGFMDEPVSSDVSEQGAPVAKSSAFDFPESKPVNVSTGRPTAPSANKPPPIGTIPTKPEQTSGVGTIGTIGGAQKRTLARPDAAPRAQPPPHPRAVQQTFQVKGELNPKSESSVHEVESDDYDDDFED